MASASVGQTVNLWDAWPLTAELQIEQLTVNPLTVWFAKPLSNAKIQSANRRSSWLSTFAKRESNLAQTS